MWPSINPFSLSSVLDGARRCRLRQLRWKDRFPGFIFIRVLLTDKYYPGNMRAMNPSIPASYTVFLGTRRLTSGPLHEVALAVLRAEQVDADAHTLVFSDASGQPVDLNLSGGEDAVVARYIVSAPAQSPKGRGRPRLGVVAREVTLLPEHWDWLAAQTGGASVALRKLVHEARQKGGAREQARQARERAYHVMSTLAGNLPCFEEASRALFADDRERLIAQMDPWPQDVRAYVLQLIEPAPG
ncbi:DUF2239 family protein [Stenotrophomonas humi]|nr:DUF2239 family protein [Stenotrophomonas humi]